jgi:DNA topoisomerase-3
VPLSHCFSIRKSSPVCRTSEAWRTTNPKIVLPGVPITVFLNFLLQSFFTLTRMTIKVLNVAEKPSVARSLAQVFGRQSDMQRPHNIQVFRHERVEFPHIFQQGNGLRLDGPITSHTMITTSVRGHLASIDFPEAYGWSKCDPSVLLTPQVPLETQYKEDMQPIFRNLQQLAREVQACILWLDCDREGEAIGDEVRTVLLQVHPQLPIYRARFSTVLPQEIQSALRSLGRLNEHHVKAVQARIELDLRVGAAFTRFQTKRLQRQFVLPTEGVVSYGPCQFPTLGFVVERWARIQTFVPEDFWFLELTLTADEANARPIIFQWKRNRLYDQLTTLILFEACLDAQEAVVISANGRPKHKWRPVPLATVELQKRASRFLHISSEQLMTAAEELYQQGYISYPRTETERFRPEFQHRPLLEQLATIPGEMGQSAQRLLQPGHFQNPRAGPNDDQAHPPITPCKAVDPASIGNPQQRRVYELVVKHYLACCSRDAVGRETQLVVRMGEEEFQATGLMVLERNWLEAYHPWERWSTGQGELPSLPVGSRIRPTSLTMKESRTTPPSPLSEVELISLMDRHGIGTDATIAQHIATIQDREYAIKDGNLKFSPTQLGIALVEGYNSMGYQLNKPDLRRETEAECNLIAAGQKTAEEVVLRLLEKMQQCYRTAVQEAHLLDRAVARHYQSLGDTSTVVQQQFTLCGACRHPMTLKHNTQGRVTRKMLQCATCSQTWALPRGQPQPKRDAQNQPVICPLCQYQVVQITTGDGYTGSGYTVCPHCFSNPPSGHAPDFRCLNCTNTECSLSLGTPDVTVFHCPFCASQGNPTQSVNLRKTSRGFVLSCTRFQHGDRCPYSLWLPKECEQVTVLDVTSNENEDGLCASCSRPGHLVLKMKFTWKRGSVPPHLGSFVTTCILCDISFRREMEISLPQLNQVIARARPATNNSTTNSYRAASTGRGRATAGRGTQRGRGGGRGGWTHASMMNGQGGRGTQRNRSGGGR